MPDPNRLKLTDAIVRRAALPEGKAELVIWDTDVTGFGLRLRGGSKTYVACYRPAGAGRGAPMKRVRIGTPETIKTATEARKIAYAMLGKVAAGGDPSKDRAEMKVRERARVGALLDAYEADLERRSYVYRKTVMATLRTRLAAHKGKDIRELRGSDYAAIIKRLEAQGLPGAADDFRSRCRTFLGWCTFEAKILDHNPLAGYRKGRGTRTERLARQGRGRALSDAELAAVWKAADPATVAGRYIRFLILTGCRRGEGAGLTRAMVDRQAGRIDLPATFTKQARGHVVYVAPALGALLDSCIVDARSDLLFPSVRTGRQMSGWTKMVAAIVKESGVPFALHDLRRTFRTGLSRLGVDADIAELALGHARGDLEARYNRDDCAAAIRGTFEAWAAHVTAPAAAP